VKIIKNPLFWSGTKNQVSLILEFNNANIDKKKIIALIQEYIGNPIMKRIVISNNNLYEIRDIFFTLLLNFTYVFFIETE
jgi:hypothetical protein